MAWLCRRPQPRGVGALSSGPTKAASRASATPASAGDWADEIAAAKRARSRPRAAGRCKEPSPGAQLQPRRRKRPTGDGAEEAAKRVCTQCGVEKEETEFTPSQSRCKVCRNSNRAAPKRARRQPAPEAKVRRFHGIGYCVRDRRWTAQCSHKGRTYDAAGPLKNEIEAARAYDALARRLRGPSAHGGGGNKKRFLLNFPTAKEIAAKEAHDAAIDACEALAVQRMAAGQRSSSFAGVGWLSKGRRWSAEIRKDGSPGQQRLGVFRTEKEAAIAYDAAARRQRGKMAHHGGGALGGSGGHNRWRLNFPTAAEKKAAAAAARKSQVSK
eukprot:COSAG04_NODE_1235_length_7625_cov_36.004651_1_plen_327_part_10